ncbi:hypothetical protein JXA34_03835 [Patescibacteria group bacterium]|nr:hypothetical protein [Patescibacteria group bacterium]
MNNSTQAQKGFQTFVLTLSVSLIIFSVIYYFVTNSNRTPDITTSVTEEVYTKDTPDSEDEASSGADTVFGKLASQEMDVPRRAVLSGATEETVNSPDETEETTESTVPNGGVVSITFGLFSSVLFLLFAAWMIGRNTKGAALVRFENQFIRD